METLANTLRRFEIPKLTPAQVAMADESAKAEEERKRRNARATSLMHSRIPAEFALAVTEDERVLAWCESPGYGLVLQGAQGRGKTHAACAALRILASKARVRFASFGDVLREWEAAREDRTSRRAVVREYVAMGVLCLDNLGRERLNAMTLPLLAEIVDKRTQAMRPTIITTTLDGTGFVAWLMAAGMPEVAKDIASRISRYERITITGEDRRSS